MFEEVEMHLAAIMDTIDEIYLLPAIGGSEEYDRTTMEKLLIIKEVIVGLKGKSHED